MSRYYPLYFIDEPMETNEVRKKKLSFPPLTLGLKPEIFINFNILLFLSLLSYSYW